MDFPTVELPRTDFPILGISYGTYLGQILAAMFPDKVERMMLDGVLNPLEYQQGWFVYFYR